MDLDIKVTGMPTYELLFHLNSDFLSLTIALKNTAFNMNSFGTHSQTQFYLLKPKSGIFVLIIIL